MLRSNYQTKTRGYQRRRIETQIGFNDFVLNPGFHHIVLDIFKTLDPKTLGYCRSVSKAWKECIDNDRHWWKLQLSQCGHLPMYRRPRCRWLIDDNRTYLRFHPKDTLEDIYPHFVNVIEKEICPRAKLKDLKLFGQFMLDYCIEKRGETDQFVRSPLHFASWNNRMDIFNFLADFAPTLNLNFEAIYVSEYGHKDVFTEACVYNRMDTIDFFMTSSQSISKGFLFHSACKMGNHDAVERFFKRSEELKLDVNQKDNFGRTPAHFAFASNKGQGKRGKSGSYR